MMANHVPSAPASLVRVLASALIGALLAGCNLFVDADAYVARGREKLAAHDYRGAVIELRNALQAEPDNAQAQLALAEASLALGDASTARAAAKRALAGGVPTTVVAPLTAQASLDLREYRELLAELDSGALPLEPAAKSVYRGEAHLGLRELDAAITAFNQTLTLDTDSARARIGLAEAYLGQKRLDAANRELDAVLAAHPGHARAWLIRGGLHAGRGDYESAEKALDKAQARASAELPVPQQVVLLVLLTEIRLVRGELEAARASQRSLVQLSGNAPVARVLAGRLALAVRDYPAAAQEFQQALNAAPNLTVARFLLGSTLVAQGSLNQAEVALAQVLEQAPDHLEARRLLARVRLELDRPDAALQALESGAAPIGDAEPGGGALALDAAPPAVAASGQIDRDLQLEAARVFLANRNPGRAVALLQKLPASEDLRREALLLTALVDERGASAAEAELERWLIAKPRDAALRELAAVFHAQTGDIARARADIAAAIALNSKSVRILLAAARVEHAGGNPTAAAAYLEKALALEPNNPSASMGLAELALRAGDVASAERRLAASIALDAKATAPRLLLARVKMQRKDIAAADKLLREAIAAEPKTAAVRLQAGKVYAGAGRYDEAVAQFKTAAQLNPTDAIAWLELARGQSALGQRSAARESLETALQQRPDWPAAVGALALLDVREGGRAQAVRRVEDLENKRPNDAAVAMMAGDIAMSLADFPKAAAAYARAAKLSPTAAAAMQAYRARRLGSLSDAARPLEDWLTRHPEDLTVRFLLAEFRGASGNTSQAIAEYERLIAVRPTPAALNNLAWAYRTSGDRRALETAKRAYAMAPKAAAVVDTYGWILLESGDVPGGAKLLEQAAELDRDDPDISYHYAAALSRRGDTAAAKARLASLLERPKSFASQADARRLFDELSRRP